MVKVTKRKTWKNPIIEWIDYRLPIFSYTDNNVIDYPTPKNLSYWWNFGSLAGMVLVIMIASGIFLAMNYATHIDHTFNSVERIMRDVNYGWLMRYLHANGASMFFLLIYIHMFRGLYYGSYKEPRQLLWILGVMIYLVMMGTAFMGYVLPWGQMSYWGATVITNLFSAFPVIGDAVVEWLWGGFSVDNPTLNRFFVLHYLLPSVIFMLVVVHLWALHVHKSNNPLGVELKKPTDVIPFHPYYTIKDLYGFGVFMIVYMGIVFWAPDFFGEPDNYIPANPLVTPAHIVPEWYFLTFYAILRAVPHKLIGVLSMFAGVAILFLLPWLDSHKIRSARFRPLYKQFFWLFVFDCLMLGYIGSQAAVEPYVTLGRIGTVYYFVHFLVILPLLGRFEKGLTPPDTIDSPVAEPKPTEII